MDAKHWCCSHLKAPERESVLVSSLCVLEGDTRLFTALLLSTFIPMDLGESVHAPVCVCVYMCVMKKARD